ncbi:hypothetical protein [Pontibacter sp. BAB1700]|uniref:hypothetical protein n=1 Tax=Pontibacter sp. BAB1700 TaxID=1144253 RepID=UPI00026BC611|nr:hypothetical protein [Pontibacter sp. BAB1700]EJF08011.1 hypothetical protein O71_23426 [Pontibacter sp. BAB1700]
MQKIINGKLYDTETATEVASYWNNLSANDFRRELEELYITKKGAWFLYGEGGPLSHYAKYSENQSWGSSEIIALTPDEAYEWCERHNKVKVIERYFSDKVEEA